MTEALWIALIVSLLSTLSVWGKSFFDYKSKKAAIKKSKGTASPWLTTKPGNPGYGERIAKLEGAAESLEKNNDKDHKLIRVDISKIFSLLNNKR